MDETEFEVFRLRHSIYIFPLSVFLVQLNFRIFNHQRLHTDYDWTDVLYSELMSRELQRVNISEILI